MAVANGLGNRRRVGRGGGAGAVRPACKGVVSVLEYQITRRVVRVPECQENERLYLQPKVVGNGVYWCILGCRLSSANR
jgi:hypothetical protein